MKLRPAAIEWALALGVFAAALALRLVYLHQVWELPFFEHPIVDARSYDEWAQRIAAGDWIGDQTFYQAPAYPYFLAIVYAVFGRDLWIAHVVQMVAGALTCVLLYAAARHLFGRAAGIATGLLAALYAPALFFDGIYQKAGLAALLTAGLVLGLARFVRRPSLAAAGACGAVLGGLALTRENALVFALVLPAWFAFALRDRPLRARVGLACAFVLGLAIVLTPVALRNYAVGGSFAITTSQLGPNFYIGNNPEATGIYAPLFPGRHMPDFEGSDAARVAEWETGRELSPGEVSSYLLAKSVTWIRAEPIDWLALMAAKILYTLNDFEIPDTEDIYVYAESSPLLAALLSVLRFGVLLPLAAAGVLLARREEVQIGVLHALAWAFAAAVALFYVWARYRFPLVPLLLPFAGLALARGAKLVWQRNTRALAAPALAACAAALVANLPLLDARAHQGVAWMNLGNIMLREQRLPEAERYLERSAEIDPDRSDLQFHFGVLRFEQGRSEESEAHLRRMLEIDPRDYRGHRLLAQILAASGRRDEAREHQIEAVRLDPNRKRRGRPGAPPAPPLRHERDESGAP